MCKAIATFLQKPCHLACNPKWLRYRPRHLQQSNRSYSLRPSDTDMSGCGGNLHQADRYTASFSNGKHPVLCVAIAEEQRSYLPFLDRKVYIFNVRRCTAHPLDVISHNVQTVGLGLQTSPPYSLRRPLSGHWRILLPYRCTDVSLH